MMKISVFLKRQLSQIRQGGWRLLLLKLKRFLSLPFLHISTSLAVYLKVEWPLAYFYQVKRLNKKYKKVLRHSDPDPLILKDIRKQVIGAYKKYISYRPSSENLSDWLAASRGLADSLWDRGEIEESNKVCQAALEVQSDILKKSGLDKLGIAFIPHFIAYGSIGNYVLLQAYIKAGLLGLSPQMKNILILDGGKINNQCFLNYMQRYLAFVDNPLAIGRLEPLRGHLTASIGFRTKIRDKLYFDHMALGIVEEQWRKENRPPLLSLLKEDIVRGQECLRALGLPENAWFACLHVREQESKDNGSRSENFRNADIKTYYPALEAVTAAGGWVIRIGDPRMTPLPQMPKVIDYAHSAFKSEWMDVFLCASCRFLIGTSSGPVSFSMAFGVPVVFTNFMPLFGAYCFSPKDLFLPRLCRHQREGRLLSFKELFSPPVSTAFSQFFYDEAGIKIITNEPEELKALVKEMIGRLDGTFKYSAEEERLQERFWALTSRCGNLHGGDEARVYARIGKDFLRKYESLLPEQPIPVLEN